MSRDTMGLTLADLEILQALVQRQPPSHSAAAGLLGINRARLSRLIQRVNQRIGEELDWYTGGRFEAPPEVRRLVSRYAAFSHELDELGRAPRVSAGTSATLLLAEFLREIGRQMPRLTIVRTRDVFQALASDDIDVALTHGYAVGAALGLNQQELRPGITGLPLVEWKAVLITREGSEKPNVRSAVQVCWEPGSTGDWLSQKAGKPTPLNSHSLANIPCESFIHAVEFVRRGLIEGAVVPDIYLPRPAAGLILESPSTPVADQLVAIFRTREQPRWAWLFDRLAWKRVADRHRTAE